VLLLAIAAVSAGVLGYQILLARLFAIVQWHHFAYMIVSMALLGYGASGTFLTLTRARLAPHFAVAFSISAATFGITAVASFIVGQLVPFNPLAVIWDGNQLVNLFRLYALFTAPFFFGANCVGLAFACQADHVGRIYRADLIGAGGGALAMLVALFFVRPETALWFIAGLGFLGAALMTCQARKKRWRVWTFVLLLSPLALALAAPVGWTTLRLSEYKGLAIALTVPNARIVVEYSSPLGLVSVVESPTIPFRHAPGLSLNNTAELPAQLGIFTDGDSLNPITAFDGRLDALASLDFAIAALPYHLRSAPRVLILGSGGGADVLRALYHGASAVDAVELNPDIIRLVREDYADFAGRLYSHPLVRVHLREARGFVRTSTDSWDIVELPLFDSLAMAAAGTLGLSESYVYTVEAFEDYLGRLRPGGVLSITRWLKVPPRDTLKMFVTAVVALERSGTSEPMRQIALLWSWSTTALLVKNEPFSGDEIATIRRFARERSFDVGYLPGLLPNETNRFNVLAESYFLDGAVAMLGPHRAEFVDRYKFDIAPATDDRPYFFDFFRWRALPELIAIRTQAGAALFDWGYLILVATLAQAAALSALLILLPLVVGRAAERSPGRWHVAAYFFAIGLAFLFVEIASIQRFVLFLAHPLYAIAVVLAGFLIFAGFGASAASRMAKWLEERRQVYRGTSKANVTWLRAILHPSPIALAICVICVIAAFYAFGLPAVFRAMAGLPEAGKIGLSLLLIGPLAFWMGMPFPLALSRVTASQPELVAWAWGINGCASVISAVLAQVLAMSVGFSAVMMMAIGLYLAAAVLRGRFESRHATPTAV